MREAGSGSCFNELSPDWEEKQKHTHRLGEDETQGKDVDMERKGFQNEEAQCGEVGSEFQRTLKDGSVGMGPCKNIGPDKTNSGNCIFNPDLQDIRAREYVKGPEKSCSKTIHLTLFWLIFPNATSHGGKETCGVQL